MSAEATQGVAAASSGGQGPAASAAAPVVPSFDVVRVEPSGETVVAGLAEPGSTVDVLDGANTVATAEANNLGEWAMALDKPLPPGTHDLAIRTTSKDGGVTMLSDQRVAVSVPQDKSNNVLVVLNKPGAASKVLEVPPAQQQQTASSAPAKAPSPPAAASQVAETTVGQPAAEAPAPAQMTKAGSTGAAEQAPGSASLTATAANPAATGAGSGTEVVMAAPSEPQSSKPAGVQSSAETPQTAPAQAAVEPAVTVASVEADTSGEVYVTGTAATGQPVRVYVDNQPIGETKPDASGAWQLAVKREMPPGTYQVRADQVDQATGDVIARAEVPFEREIDVATLKPMVSSGTEESSAVSGQAPGLETIVIRRGDNLWRIARRAYGRGIRYSTIYQANREQIRNPHWIYPGQVFVVPAGNTAWQK